MTIRGRRGEEPRGGQAATPGRPRSAALVAGLVGALLVAAVWPLLHTAQPLLPTDDLYTHLSVARHLAQGDGFVCDIAYPLSFAWPFARALPQPLVHRPPAWPVALVVPYLLAGPDPGRAVQGVRVLQVAVLAGIAGLGVAAWVRRNRPGAAIAWVLILGACPLLPYAVDWGHAELPAAAVLLLVWLRHREGAVSPGLSDGLATAVLALLRPELAWLPLAWCVWLRRPGSGARRPFLRGLGVALAVTVVLVAPWVLRNARLAGDPFFSVQAHAELAKDTRVWPGYDVYRQLEPQSPQRALRDYPEALARKAARGVRFYAQEFPALLPWVAPLLLGAVAIVSAGTGRRRRQPSPGARSPATAAVLSTIAAAALYAPFDHSLRHLVSLAPVIAFEAAPWLGEWPFSLLPVRLRPRRPLVAAAAAALLTVPLLALTAREPTGWAGTAGLAAQRQADTRAEVERLRSLPPGSVAFTESAAAAWFAGRPAVWSPLDSAVSARIAAWLDRPATVAPGQQP